MDIAKLGLTAVVFLLYTPLFIVFAKEDPKPVLGPFDKETIKSSTNAPTTIRVPIPKSCTIDLKGKSEVSVRVLGSREVFHYPLIRPNSSNMPFMALENGLARELMEAPVYRAYAVPKYGIGYGYDGAGLLVYSGLLIEGCPLPTPVTGLFVPVQLASPYVNRDFLTQYFSVLNQDREGITQHDK